MKVIIVAAQALTAIQQKKLEKAFIKTLVSKPEFEYQVNQSLLGGLKVTFGSTEINATLAHKLDQLQTKLAQSL